MDKPTLWQTFLATIVSLTLCTFLVTMTYVIVKQELTPPEVGYVCPKKIHNK